MSELHSKFKLTVQREEAPPASCPPKKPAKVKAEKKQAKEQG
tara:strand:+ start:45 stop:170 length:126 start_codon:yes stop_codon:yes gene_type:complete